jgi:hypothetical protein
LPADADPPGDGARERRSRRSGASRPGVDPAVSGRAVRADVSGISGTPVRRPEALARFSSAEAIHPAAVDPRAKPA